MKRWLGYGIIGIGFGVLDFFFMQLVALVAQRTFNNYAMVLQFLLAITLYGAVWLVWLIPLVPTVLREWRQTGKLRATALAGAWLWAMAMVGYYLTYALYLLVLGAPHMEHLLLSNLKAPNYWYYTYHALQGIVLGQFLEWIVPGLVLGAIASWLTVLLYRWKVGRFTG